MFWATIATALTSATPTILLGSPAASTLLLGLAASLPLDRRPISNAGRLPAAM
jgi:hypothetical protein